MSASESPELTQSPVPTTLFAFLRLFMAFNNDIKFPASMLLNKPKMTGSTKKPKFLQTFYLENFWCIGNLAKKKLFYSHQKM